MKQIGTGPKRANHTGKTNPQSSTPYRAAALLLTVAAAALLAGTLYLNLGWDRSQISVQQSGGDAAELQGFTFSGQVGMETAALDFLVQDGQVQSKLRLKELQTEQHSLGVRLALALPLDQYGAASTSAMESLHVQSRRVFFLEHRQMGLTYSFDTDQVECTLVVDEYDGWITHSLRLDLGRRTLKTPSTAYAVLEQSGQNAQDYNFNGASEELEAIAMEMQETLKNGFHAVYFAGQQIFSLVGVPGAENALYRVDEMLTQSQIDALAPNAAIGRTKAPVLASATPYGAYTMFYAIEQGQQLEQLIALQDHLCLVLRSVADEYTLIFLDAEGTQTGQYHLGELDAVATDHETPLLQPVTALREDELVFTYQNAAGQNAAKPYTTRILRIGGGQVVQDRAVVSAAPPVAAALDESTQKLLLVTASTQTNRLQLTQQQLETRGAWQWEFNANRLATLHQTTLWMPQQNGYELCVYSAHPARVLYTGLLTTGEDITWDADFQNVIMYSGSMGASSGVLGAQLDTPQQRAARWPEQEGTA